MSLHKVRSSHASFALLEPHFPAFRAGQSKLRRDQNMNQARNLKKDPVMAEAVKLYVSLARDDHHEYLASLREIRDARVNARLMKDYERTVMDRVMGVLHR